MKTKIVLLTGLLCCSPWLAAKEWLIDVRSPEEFATSHLASAINLPYDQIVPALAQRGASKEDTLYLYCRSGRRAGIARDELTQIGYQHVENLGGMEQAQNWQQAHQPASHAGSPVLPPKER